MLSDADRRTLFTRWESLAEMLCRAAAIQRAAKVPEMTLNPTTIPDELRALVGTLDEGLVQTAWASGMQKAGVLPEVSEISIVNTITAAATSIGASSQAANDTTPHNAMSLIFTCIAQTLMQMQTERDQLRAILEQQTRTRPVPAPVSEKPAEVTEGVVVADSLTTEAVSTAS